MEFANWINWKQALFFQTIFYSLALLQQDFFLGQLWFIMNCFCLLLLLRAAYSENAGGRLMAWYVYTLSIVTDILSLSIFGHNLDSSGDVYTFVLVMAIFLLLPKPVFAYFLYHHLRSQGIDVKQGSRYNPLTDQFDNDYSVSQKNDYAGPMSNQQEQQQQQQRSSQSNSGNQSHDFNSNNMQSQQPIQNNVQQSSYNYNGVTPGNNI